MSKRLITILIVSFVGVAAHAGKVESVQAEVKKSCGKDVGADDALKMVKSIFLSCSPGSKVDTDLGCKVNCLKDNSGAVVGG